MKIKLFACSLLVLTINTLIWSCYREDVQLEGNWKLLDVIIEGKSLKDSAEEIIYDKKTTDYLIFDNNSCFEMNFSGKISKGKWWVNSGYIIMNPGIEDSAMMSVFQKDKNHIELVSRNSPRQIKLILVK